MPDVATIPICIVLMVLLIVVCCFALRPRRIIFKRVLIEKSPLYATSNIDIVYKPPKITVVNEKKLPFTVYLRKVFQREEFRGFPNLDETSSGFDIKEDSYLSRNSSTKTDVQSNPRVHFFTPSDKSFEVPLNQLRVERPLGQGAFGLVYFGSAVNLPGDIKGPIPVAIKTLRETSSEADLVAFVQEIEMMKFIGKHENVVQLYATTSYKGRPVMVMEYGARGSLKNFLQKHSQLLAHHPKSLNIQQLKKFALQIAKGMVYLVSKGVSPLELKIIV
ncbi:unnamed protein product [Hymenolepis diminuta]|uniref:Protein kinase domain-containing protein n=2 Tax=Hymenolepis diminuta TaxID=6216 RepID=A0A0R3SIG7_HYMDI|nr:unnamed protein product [Hymenolepis diminuta]